MCLVGGRGTSFYKVIHFLSHHTSIETINYIKNKKQNKTKQNKTNVLHQTIVKPNMLIKTYLKQHPKLDVD